MLSQKISGSNRGVMCVNGWPMWRRTDLARVIHGFILIPVIRHNQEARAT